MKHERRLDDDDVWEYKRLGRRARNRYDPLTLAILRARGSKKGTRYHPEGYRTGGPYHGTLNMATRYGCKCPECKAARNAYERERYARKRAADPDFTSGGPRHGTLRCAVDYGCEHPDCLALKRTA